VYYLIDQSTRNWLNISIEGFDAQFDYQFDLTDRVPVRVGASGTYFTTFEQNFGSTPKFSVLNTSGFNGVFPSIEFKARSYIGFNLGDFSADLFWNHVGDYNNWSGNTVTPLTRDANGNPSGGGDTVEGANTFDLHLSQTVSFGGTFDNLTLSLDIRNIADEDPPFFNGNLGGFMGGAWGYDNYNSNPVGRLITLGLRANF
jgi:iron complex outermembrane receptor protein